MKYFKLANSLDIKEIGKYPQSIIPKNIGNISDVGQFGPIKNIIVPEPVLQSKANETTYLKIDHINSLNFLVLKQYFIDFIKEFNIGNFQNWSLKVHHKNNILTDYSLFHLSYPSQEKYVDYKNSDLLIGQLGDWKDKSNRRPIDVKNYNDYKNIVKTLRDKKASKNKSQMRCHKLVLDLSKVKEDIFRLTDMPNLGNGYYISEKLKNAIEENKYTGMAFKEISELDKRIEIIY